MRIGIDMDGVIVDTTPALIKQANIACKTKLTMEDIIEPSMAALAWKHTSKSRRKQMGITEAKQLNSWLFPPDFFVGLPPIEGAIDAVRKMAEAHEIAIITKPVEWSCCTYEKEEWLRKHLDDVPYKLIMVGDMEAKGWIGADIIIDDDIRVIRACTLAIPVLIKQPWNALYLNDIHAHIVESIAEVPDILDDIKITELFK